MAGAAHCVFVFIPRRDCSLRFHGNDSPIFYDILNPLKYVAERETEREGEGEKDRKYFFSPGDSRARRDVENRFRVTYFPPRVSPFMRAREYSGFRGIEIRSAAFNVKSVSWRSREYKRAKHEQNDRAVSTYTAIVIRDN